MASLSTSASDTTSPRRQRYNRSATTSVTQLLSDGYSSFINRLTRRGPSEKTEIISDTKLTATRPRFDDKLISSKNSVLANVRRYENNGHISPYTSSLTSGAPARKLNDDRTYSSYLGATKSRIDTSPLHSASGISALGRTDSFRRAHLKDKSSPFTKRYPLKESNNNIDSISLGSTRSRLEDKYSSVLDRIAVQKKERARREKEDRDKTLEPETPLSRGLMRSLTTAVFGENSFKRNNFSHEKIRDKTPFRNTADRRLSSNNKQKEEYKNGFDIPLKDRPYYGKDRDSVYRRHQRRSLRAEKSETSDKKMGKLSLRPVDLNIHSGVRDLISPLQHSTNDTNGKFKTTKTPVVSPAREVGRQKQIYFPSSDEDDDKTPVGDRVLSERETRRKEIQGLIMKYAHLDEMYGRIGSKDMKETTDAVTAKTVEPLTVGDVVLLPPELRARQRPQRPRHLTRQAVTPPVSTS